MLQSTDRHTRQIGQSSRSIGRIAVLVMVAQKGKGILRNQKMTSYVFAETTHVVPTLSQHHMDLHVHVATIPAT